MNPDTNKQPSISFSEERFRIILSHTYSWENWISNEGVLLWVNHAVEKFTGYSVAECHQKTSFPYCVLEQKCFRRVKTRIKDGIKSGKTTDNIELAILRKDGTKAWMASTWKPVYNAKGDLIGTWVTFHDITKLKKTGEQLKRANQKLRKTNIALNEANLRVEEATMAKNIFLANTSHEIRTPMNGILGMIDLLKRTSLNKKQIGFLDVIDHSASHLLSIINDLLDISKIEAGELVFEKSPFYVTEIIDEMLNISVLEAKNRGIELVSHLPEELKDIQLVGDSVRLKQVIWNLVNNGIKFTKEGKVSIRLQIINKTENQIQLNFEVFDTGIGIAKSQFRKIFNPFAQADGSSTRKYGGTGLGLSICKQLVEMMGGRIQIQSEVGKGSVFSFKLEFPYSSGHRVTSQEIPGKPVQIKGIKIMVADDNKYNQLITKEFIREMGAIYDYAYNGFEVLEKVRLNHYDLILMDIQMPAMDGVEATRRIRKSENPHLKQIPIIAISASAQKKKREWYLNSGMNDFITKPFRAEELKKKIIKHLSNKRVLTISKQPTVDLSALENLSGGDKNFISYSVGLFLNNVKLLQDHLNDYIRKGEMERAASLVHQTKPAFVHIGLHALFDKLDMLETKLLKGQKEGEIGALVSEIIQELDLVIPEIKYQLERIGVENDH
jgi:PAS domain S-box-containing protein